jgi:hypothetical protein
MMLPVLRELFVLRSSRPLGHLYGLLERMLSSNTLTRGSKMTCTSESADESAVASNISIGPNEQVQYITVQWNSSPSGRRTQCFASRRMDAATLNTSSTYYLHLWGFTGFTAIRQMTQGATARTMAPRIDHTVMHWQRKRVLSQCTCRNSARTVQLGGLMSSGTRKH